MITALIKYERLPDFCYGCGFIGHSFREYHNSEVRKSFMEGVEPKFGMWLRASPLDRSKNRQRGEYSSEAKPKAQEDIEEVDRVALITKGGISIQDNQRVESPSREAFLKDLLTRSFWVLLLEYPPLKRLL
ncbi:hypothetical protein ACOSQ3_032519 [Xanthoceras sorbifolium]